MAHTAAHKQVSGWLPTGEAVALEALASEHERSVSAELRLAVRNWLALHAAEVPTVYAPKTKGEA